MDLRIRSEQGYQYVEEGSGPNLVLLHGLFGALSNFQHVFEAFGKDYRVIIPLLPIFEKSHADATVAGLTDYLEGFFEAKKLGSSILMGNSLGGHIALVFALRKPELASCLILTGSSGLFESGMGSGFPRRSSYEFIKERVGFTFYDPNIASKEMVDEIFEAMADNFKTLRVIKTARSAQRHNLRYDLPNIQAPTLLVWGLNDNITPPHVAHEFEKLIPKAELAFIDKCGHAPMMEQPAEFNRIVHKFLQKHMQVIA
ncbi:MAG: alpha/beta fold hydrolase [Bacteroidota bacterium]